MRRLMVFVSLIFILPACRQQGITSSSNSGSENNSNLFEDEGGCETFEPNVQSIISNNCLQCHDAGLTSPDLSDAANNLSSLSSSIARTITEGTMPPSGELGSIEKETIAAWQQSGFPKSLADCPSGGTGSTSETEDPIDEGLPNSLASGTSTTGSTEAVQFAFELWGALRANNYIGANRRLGFPIAQTLPDGVTENAHGLFVETLVVPNLKVGNQDSFAAVKFNYGPTDNVDPSTDRIINDRDKYLKAITVYYGGQSSQTGLFWAKYFPNGELDIIPDTTTRLAGEPGGCIGCHGNAKGNDYIFTNDPLSHE